MNNKKMRDGISKLIADPFWSDRIECLYFNVGDELRVVYQKGVDECFETGNLNGFIIHSVICKGTNVEVCYKEK